MNSVVAIALITVGIVTFVLGVMSFVGAKVFSTAVDPEMLGI